MTSAKDYARDDVSHGCVALDLDGRAQAFAASIRDALIARGELTCVDGVWHVATRGTLDIVAHAPWLACCDFCSARPVTWNVACGSFQLGDGRSDSDWVACAQCGTLIQRQDRDGLFTRARLAEPATGIEVPPDVRTMALRALHRQFWKHYQGRVTAITPHPFGH